MADGRKRFKRFYICLGPLKIRILEKVVGHCFGLMDVFVNIHYAVFKRTIRKYKNLPIIFMLPVIQIDVMVKIQKRRDKMFNNFVLIP